MAWSATNPISVSKASPALEHYGTSTGVLHMVRVGDDVSVVDVHHIGRFNGRVHQILVLRVEGVVNAEGLDTGICACGVKSSLEPSSIAVVVVPIQAVDGEAAA